MYYVFHKHQIYSYMESMMQMVWPKRMHFVYLQRWTHRFLDTQCCMSKRVTVPASVLNALSTSFDSNMTVDATKLANWSLSERTILHFDVKWNIHLFIVRRKSRHCCTHRRTHRRAADTKTKKKTEKIIFNSESNGFDVITVFYSNA